MSAAKKPARKKMPAGRPVGRPTKRTPAMVEVMCVAIREGCAPEAAARIAGIARSTLYEWLDVDEQFRTACERAAAEAKTRVAKALFDAATRDGNVTAAIWWQKCRDHEFREPKDQPVTLESRGDGLQGMLAMMHEMARKVASGEVAPSVLADMATVVERVSAVIERADLEGRIAALEAKR